MSGEEEMEIRKKGGGTGCEEEHRESDDSNRQGAKSMVQMAGMWVNIVKGVCGNCVMIEKFEKQK